MENITVNKADLVATITENRDAHRAQFLEAQERFRARAIEMLDAHLERARAGKRVELAVNLPEPVDYTDSYDTALAMLQWSVHQEIELSDADFQRYVLNNWEWARHWAANTSSYLAG